MTNVEIIKKLIGPINPLGDASRDDARFENLKAMCDLVASLVQEIDRVSYDNRNSYEGTVRRAADYAGNFLTNSLGITE